MGASHITQLSNGGVTMSKYIVLLNWTEQGLKSAKDVPLRIENTTKALEAAGCKMIGWYAVMGQYDAVAIIEAPNDEVAVTQLLAASMPGNIRTTTLRAFTKEEFTEILNKLP
jgi:uncharacterized protein with GYD domain